MYSYLRSNSARDPQITAAAITRTSDPATKAPMSAGLAFLRMLFLRWAVVAAASEEVAYAPIIAVREELAGRPRGDLALGGSVEKHAAVADREDAGELVRDHDERSSEARP